jgi:hypothetical protein
MTDSKVKLRIEFEGEGEAVEYLARLLEALFKTEQPPAPPKRLEDIEPAVNIAPSRYRIMRR